jgi:hypothetical protein
MPVSAAIFCGKAKGSELEGVLLGLASAVERTENASYKARLKAILEQIPQDYGYAYRFEFNVEDAYRKLQRFSGLRDY